MNIYVYAHKYKQNTHTRSVLAAIFNHSPQDPKGNAASRTSGKV